MDEISGGGLSAEHLAPIVPTLKGAVERGDLSGIVTLIWRKGGERFFDAVGKRDIAHNKPMTRDTLFRIASMTKPITSVTALMLMEEGKLRLDDPIAKWAPEFSQMRVLRDPTGPLDDIYESPRPITIEDVMTHRAGLAYAFSASGPITEAYDRALGAPLDSPLTPDEWIARLAKLPLLYPPGERFFYSHATELLGFLIGRIEGRPFRDVLIERIFSPLGMHDTDFWVPPEKRDRMAVLYKNDDVTNRLTVQPWPLHDSPPAYCAGGGGLISTVDDYLKFARAMLNKGEVDGVRLVKLETIALMTANRLTPEQRAQPFFGLPFWASQGFGLGVSMIMDPAIHEMMGAGRKGAFGWPGVFGTWWQADPAEDMILIYLIQNSIPLNAGAGNDPNAGRRMAARAALPMFQKMAYAAIER